VSAGQSPIPASSAAANSRTSNRERRGWERYRFDQAEGKLIHGQSTMPCRFVDISLGGCCVSTEKRFAAGALARVEVLFDLHGMPQRIAGITQWTGKNNQIGIRFVHATPQAKNQFVALLTGLIDEGAAEAVREVVESAPVASAPVQTEPTNSAQATGHPAAVEPSTVELAQGESQAVIRLLKDGSQIAGAVVDLSLECCTLRLVRAFTLGIYVRVEISFHLRGLTFQVAGVSHEVYDKHTVGFRFLDVSKRRLEELAQAIGEMSAGKQQ